MPGFNIPRPGQSSNSYESNTQEAGRKHRYNVSIAGVGPMVTFNVKTITQPSIEFDEILVHNGQDQIPLPGKHKYKPIEISFYEALSGTGGGFKGTITEQLAKLCPNISAISYLRIPSEYMFNMEIFRLDGIGNSYLTYKLFGCHLALLDPGDLSYADNEISTVTATIKYGRYEAYHS